MTVDLDDPAVEVDEDELAPEDVIVEDDEAGVDANGRREAAAITALRHLGPATAREIADHIGDVQINNVSTRLRQLEQEGRVRRGAYPTCRIQAAWRILTLRGRMLATDAERAAIFGSWNAAIEAAGFVPRRPGIQDRRGI